MPKITAKTAALFAAATQVGPVIAGQEGQTLYEYGLNLGIAFQIADDILDIVGDETVVGKKLQKDAIAGKATFVDLLGLEGARNKAASLVDTAQDHLSIFGPKAHVLGETAKFVVARVS